MPNDSVALRSGLYVPAASVARGQKASYGGSLGMAAEPTMGPGRSWNRMGFALSSGGSRFQDNRTRDYESYLNAATSVPWVYQAATTVCWSYAAAEFSILAGRRSNAQAVDEDDPDYQQLMELLDNPTPWHDSNYLRETLCWHLILTGNAFMVLDNKDKLGRPHELYLLRPSRVRITPDAKTYVKKFTYVVNGQEVDYDPQDVIWFKRANPKDQYWGMGVIEPGEAVFQRQKAIARTIGMYFEAGARVKGVLTYDGTLSEEQEDDLRQQWRMMDEGQVGELKTAILQAGMDYKPISSDILSNGPGMVEMAKEARQEILALFGVPEAKVGIFESANYRSIEADSFFLAETMAPLLRGTDPGWTRLARRFNPQWRYAHNKIVVTDYFDKAQTAHYMAQAAAFTRNDIRVSAGKEPFPEGDPMGEQVVGPTSMTVFDAHGGLIEKAESQPGPGAGDGPEAFPTTETGLGDGLTVFGSKASACPCPQPFRLSDPHASAAALGICSAHAPAVDAALDLGRRRRYSPRQIVNGYPQERYPGVRALIGQ